MKRGKNKFGAKKVKTDDGTFDSQAEYRRWCELKVQVRQKYICDLKRQQKFRLDVNGKPVASYVADFSYNTLPHGMAVVEDVKGVKTPVYNLKKKLMLAIHGIEIQEVAA